MSTIYNLSATHSYWNMWAANSIGFRYVALNLKPKPQALNPEGGLTACQPSPKNEKKVYKQCYVNQSTLFYLKNYCTTVEYSLFASPLCQQFI